MEIGRSRAWPEEPYYTGSNALISACSIRLSNWPLSMQTACWPYRASFRVTCQRGIQQNCTTFAGFKNDQKGIKRDFFLAFTEPGFQIVGQKS